MLLASACACWALDNNLTQKLSLRDPFAIVRVKPLVAVLTNTALGLIVVHGALPSGLYFAGALVLGSLSYGVSVVLDAYALRLIGAAREAAYFATATFVGALASVFVRGDFLGWRDAVAIMHSMLWSMSICMSTTSIIATNIGPTIRQEIRIAILIGTSCSCTIILMCPTSTIDIDMAPFSVANLSICRALLVGGGHGSVFTNRSMSSLRR